MSFAGGTYFTNKGKALHAKAIAGADLVFTRLAMGDGELGSSQSISELTDLINQKLSVGITGLRALAGGIATIKGAMSNEGLATGFYWRELGLFATDPDEGEILYCYGNAGALAEYIPAEGGAEILEKVIGIRAVISDVASVTAVINESLVYALQSDLEDHIASASHIHYAVDSGTTDAYAVTLSPVPTAYTAGMMVVFMAATANTGAATLNCNSLGDVAIKKMSAAGLVDLVTGDIVAGDIVAVIYNGTYWVAIAIGLGAHLAEDATLTAKGHIQLQTIVDTSESKALTPKALNDYQEYLCFMELRGMRRLI